MGAGFALKFMPPHHLPKEGAEEVDAEPPGEGIEVLQGDLEAMPAEETDLRTSRQGDADGDYRLYHVRECLGYCRSWHVEVIPV